MARKRASKKTPRQTPPPDDFEIDWDLIKSVHNDKEHGSANDTSDTSTVQDVFFSFQGCDDETQEVEVDYNLTYEEKFDVFVDALAEDTDSEVELTDAEYSAATNFTQTSELTQETILESSQKPVSESSPIPTTIHVSNEKTGDDPLVATRTDGLLPGVAEKIYGGNRKKTKQKYKKWYLRYVEYGRSEGQNIFVESTACNFFHNMIERKVFGVGSVWSIYAAINNTMRRLHRVKMNSWEDLRRLLIGITKWYIPKKSDILTKDQLYKVLTECFDPSDPEDLLSLIVCTLMFSGLLRQCEVMEILVSWVKVDSKNQRIYVDYKDSTKSRARGFGFMLPPKLYPFFVSYIRQIMHKKDSPVPLKNTRFLKNFNKRTGKRFQNMGRDRINKILRRIETFLNLEANSLTAHCFRRTAATMLANSGISLLGLKRAGRWKGIKSAEEYLEHSLPTQRDRMERLDPFREQKTDVSTSHVKTPHCTKLT